MKELLKIFLVLFFISLITFSTLSVFAEDSDTSNQTNDTNETNKTNEINKTVANDAVIQPMASTSVSINITPQSVNLGTWPADGAEHTYSGITTVQVHATGWWGFFNTSGDLTVRAKGDFTRGTDISKTISLSNFKYDCPNYVSKTPFTTTDSEIDQYAAGWGGNTYIYTINYYLTIPTGTDPGTYNTTIIYTAT